MPETRQLQGERDEENEFGHGLLHKAVIHNNVKDFKTLLENGHDLSQRDELGFSPLHLAALLGRNEIISEMIRIRDEEINTEETKIFKKGLDSLSKRDLGVILNCIDIDEMTVNGQTPLNLCIKNGHADTLSLLLQLGNHTEKPDRSKMFPLGCAELLKRSGSIRMENERAPPLSAKYNRKSDIVPQANFDGSKVENSTEEFDETEEFDDIPITIENKTNSLPECRNLGTELAGVSKRRDDESASEVNKDEREISDDNAEWKTSESQKIIATTFLKSEEDSCKSDLSASRLKNICTDKYNMENTCHGEEYCKGLEYCSNPHQKLGFFEKGYTINKKTLSEGCNDGNHDLQCAAGECFGIALKTHAFDIIHEMMRSKVISNSYPTIEDGNDTFRNGSKSMISKCSNITLWKGDNLNISKEDRIARIGNLEAPSSIGQIRKSFSAPEIGIETDHDSTLVRRTGWHTTQSIEFSDYEVETLNIERKVAKTYSDNHGALVNDLNCYEEKCEVRSGDIGSLEENPILYNAERDSSNSPKSLNNLLPFYDTNERQCTTHNQEQLTEDGKDASAAVANLCDTTVSDNQDHPHQKPSREFERLKSQTNEAMEEKKEQNVLHDLGQSFIDGNSSDSNYTERVSKRHENLLTTGPCLSPQQEKVKQYIDLSAPDAPIAHNIEADSCTSLQLSLNGIRVETYDNLFVSASGNLSGNGTLSNGYEKLNLHYTEVDNRLDGTACPGLKLCSDCLFKRKINHFDDANLRLNTDMGTSHSANTTPVNDHWEIWELNNNKNDGRKEWNSPNRTCTKRQQNLSAFPSRSCSLPDLLNAEYDSLTERELSESVDCLLVDPDKEVTSRKSTLRRHSLPEPSELPSWPIKPCSEQALGNGIDNKYKEVLVPSSEPSPFKSVEDCFGNKDINCVHFNEAQSSESRSTCGTLSPAVSDPMLHSLSPLISPVHIKPELPYKFCENIYHIRSDSDLQGKYRKKFHPRSTDDDMLSRSTSYLSQCFLEEVVDYFPCKDDSHLSIAAKHQCYDWNLCIEPHCESDKNHLTVSMKSRDDHREDDLDYSYICSEDEDLAGSFICSDCGSTVPQISTNDNEDGSVEGFVEVEIESKTKDEFVLICVPNRNDGLNEEVMNKCGSLNVYHREEIARNRRLSGVHGSLENIEETDIEMDYEDIDQDANSLVNIDCKLNDDSIEKDTQNGKKKYAEEFGNVNCNTDTSESNNYPREMRKNVSCDVIDLDKEINESMAVQNDIKKFDSDIREGKKQDALYLSAAESSNPVGNSHGMDSVASRNGEKVDLGVAEIDGDQSENEGASSCLENLISKSNLGYAPQGDCISRNGDLITGEDKGQNPTIKLTNIFSKDNGLVGKDVVSSREKKTARCDFSADNIHCEEDQENLKKSSRRPTKSMQVEKNLPNTDTTNKREIMEMGNKCETSSYGNALERHKRAEGVVNKIEKVDSKEERVVWKGIVNEDGKGSVVDKSKLVAISEVTSTESKLHVAEEDVSIPVNFEALPKEQTAREWNAGILENDCKLEQFDKNVLTGENPGHCLKDVVASNKDDNFKIRDLHQVEDESVLRASSIEEETNGIAEHGQELLPPLSIHCGEDCLNFAAIFREKPETDVCDCVTGSSKVSLHKSNLCSDASKQETLCDSQTCAVEIGGKRDEKKIEKFLVEDGDKRNELKKTENVNRRYSKCKLNFSTSESENCEHNFRDCSCSAEGSSYGCLKCSCERGISQSTSESIISADTGIDVDDVCFTDWDEFNQCLDVGSTAGEICACGRKQRFSSTPVGRKAPLDCSRRELTSKKSCQKRDVDENTEEEKLSMSHEATYNVDYDLIVPSSCEIRENDEISGEEDRKGNDTTFSEQFVVDLDVQCTPNAFSSTDKRVIKLVKTHDQSDGQASFPNKHRQDGSEHVLRRRSKVTEYGGDLIVLLRRMAKKAKHGFDIKVIANRNGSSLQLKLFVLNFENEEAFRSLNSKYDSQTYALANAKTATLSSALELSVNGKRSIDVRSTVINCVNLCGKGRKVNINECWFMKSPKILAMVLITIAEGSDPLGFKVELANALLSNVYSYATCPMSAIINWVLTKLGFIKCESHVDAISNISATLILFSKLIAEPYFELKSIRQLAFLTARPRVHAENEEKARKEFLCACLRIEIRNFAFSCKYAFKIFTSVQMLLCGLGDELRTAFETLDKFLIEYLHKENCLDFISDILMYLGLLKSEFRVNVTTDYKTCFQLLTHIVKQSYFPHNGVMIINAFIRKPNRLLDSVQSQKSELELVLLQRIKDSKNIEAE